MSGSLITYFDACSLAYQAEARFAGCVSMAADVGPMVDGLMSDGGRTSYTSDLAIHEFRSTLAKLVRSTEPHLKNLDAAWMWDSVTELMRRVRAGELTVVNTEPGVYPHASTLVDMAARDGLAFGLWDTVHLLNAVALSVEHKSVVDLVTADQGFKKFVDYRPHFSKAVNVLTLKDPSPGSR